MNFQPKKKNYEQLLLISSLISGRYFRVKSMSQAFCLLKNSTIRKRIDGQKYFFALNSIWPIYNFQSMKKFTCKHIYYFYWFQGKIYVTGGFGASKAILSSQEVYDPETDRWTKMPAMKKMCGFVGGVLVDRPVHFQDRPISNSTTATTS